MVNQEKSLKQRVFNSSLWTLGGYAWTQIARLASNVILAKLLFPEAFGLMMLVAVFIQGIGMFSDIGTGQSIIQNKRGDEPAFLNTAWTLQIIRGFAIWIIASLGASTYAKIFDEPSLAVLIPVAALTAVIAGFNSTALTTANRKLNLKKVTILNAVGQAISISVMIIWVLIHPSVWGLVGGGIVGGLIRMLLSHAMFGGFINRIHLEREATNQLFRFGKWIFFSTVITFFTMQIDRLLFGYFMGTSMLGVYSIAAMFTMVSQSAIQMLSGKVLFPSYSEVIRSGDDKKLYRILKKTRLIMIAGSWSLSFILITLGPQIISLLYDDRYSDAVWMIQILPLGALIGVLSLTYQNAMLAKGHSLYVTITLSIQLIIQIAAITIGHQVNGVVGIIIGYTIVGWLLYPFSSILARRIKLWQPEIDLPVIVFAILFVALYSNFIHLP